MFLKQLKQFTLSASRRNAVFKTDVNRLVRFYGSPAVCESFRTSKVYKRLSREDRRALVESFVNEYRVTNAGRFPTLDATYKEVGGSYYIVREIFQELKLKPKLPMPVVAKALSEVSPSVQEDASSHFSPLVVEPELQAGSLDIETVSEQRQDIIDTSHSDSDDESNIQGNNLAITATDEKRETETTRRIEVCLKNSEAEDEGNLTHLGNQERQAGSLDIESGSEQRHDIIDTSHSDPDDESNLQGNNLVITATDEKRETETPRSTEVEVCLKNSETEEDGNLTHLGNQESKADHLEGAVVSADVVPTETRQVSKTGAGEVKEKSSAWSNIMSFAKGIANFWRKG